MRFLPVLLLVAAVLQAADDDHTDAVFTHLHLKDGVKLVEGPRGLDAAFPYIKGLSPKTLPRFVEPIRDVKQAADAVRLFVAGVVVRDAEQAGRIIAAARDLKKKLKRLEVKIAAHLPESYQASAKQTEDGFEVSLFAFEMDRMLQLVHVKAKVKRDGTVTIERDPIVSGPMTSWQTAAIEPENQDPKKIAAAMEAETEMRAEAVKARARYAKALQAARDLDTAWAIARLTLSLEQIEDLWGKPDRTLGSGLMIRAYALEDGTALMVGASGRTRAPTYVRQVKSVQTPETVRNLYTLLFGTR